MYDFHLLGHMFITLAVNHGNAEHVGTLFECLWMTIKHGWAFSLCFILSLGLETMIKQEIHIKRQIWSRKSIQSRCLFFMIKQEIHIKRQNSNKKWTQSSCLFSIKHHRMEQSYTIKDILYIYLVAMVICCISIATWVGHLWGGQFLIDG